MKVQIGSVVLLMVVMGWMAQPVQAEATEAREVYEWRTYMLNGADDYQLIDDYLSKALIPALGRIGAGPVGVFKEVPSTRKPKKNKAPAAPREPMLHVLITYPSLAVWDGQKDALAHDKAYQSAARAYLEVAKEDAAYKRIKTRLFKAFTGWPKINVGDANAERLFEMRTYSSYSENKHILKVEMFNKYEFEVFNQVGFNSVFYGQAIAGENIPSLTYMLRYKDAADQDALWKKFRTEPLWIKLKGNTRYKNTVSKNESIMLKPTAYSQL